MAATLLGFSRLHSWSEPARAGVRSPSGGTETASEDDLWDLAEGWGILALPEAGGAALGGPSLPWWDHVVSLEAGGRYEHERVWSNLEVDACAVNTWTGGLSAEFPQGTGA
ncbi:MAG: hypothetical protein JXQ71_12690 [Verrucomicrobia bacterium]|nr:hypothetical protein [Verrucomicrobiota bacterium]